MQLASRHTNIYFVYYHDVTTCLILTAYTISYLALLGAMGIMGGCHAKTMERCFYTAFERN